MVVERGAHDDDGDGGAWGLGEWLEPQQPLGQKRCQELPRTALSQTLKPGMEERTLEQP